MPRLFSRPLGAVVGRSRYCLDGMVTFRYRHAKSGKDRTQTVKGECFLYLLTLHILPKGFRRARSYGFLHSCSKKLISFLQLVLRKLEKGADLLLLVPKLQLGNEGKRS
jgi:hypothetical protein